MKKILTCLFAASELVMAHENVFKNHSDIIPLNSEELTDVKSYQNDYVNDPALIADFQNKILELSQHNDTLK